LKIEVEGEAEASGFWTDESGLGDCEVWPFSGARETFFSADLSGGGAAFEAPSVPGCSVWKRPLVRPED